MEKQKGFTLLEILLVIALIAILAGIVIVAINPPKQLADGRNTQRRSDVANILNAVYQYELDNNGPVPSVISYSADCPAVGSTISEICRKGSVCTSLVDLSFLTDNSKYLVSMPVDPSNPASDVYGTGYHIVKTTDNRVTVCAKYAENNSTISLTK